MLKLVGVPVSSTNAALARFGAISAINEAAAKAMFVFISVSLYFRLLQSRNRVQRLRRSERIAESVGRQRDDAARVHLDQRPRVVAVGGRRERGLSAARARADELVVERRAAGSHDHLVRCVGQGRTGSRIRILRNVDRMLMTAEIGRAVLRDDVPEGVAEGDGRGLIQTGRR